MVVPYNLRIFGFICGLLLTVICIVQMVTEKDKNLKKYIAFGVQAIITLTISLILRPW